MRQPAGVGSAVIWHEPAEFVESFLKFRRYFTLENTIAKARIQTAGGAVSSALYGAAFGIQAANWHRFEKAIKTSTGVLEGVGRQCLHAVAYDHGMLFDPDGDQYIYSRPTCESRGFHPRSAWRVDHLS